MSFSILFLIIFSITLIYGSILFWLGLGLRRLSRQNPALMQPMISVVVCAHNEETNLAACLDCLVAQTYPADSTEIIIVDDRSTDRTPQVLSEYAAMDKRLRIITIRERAVDFAPKKFAIDQAIRIARGEIILLTDADGRPGTQWAAALVSCFSPGTDMVLGYAPYTIRSKRSPVAHILALEYLSHAAIAAATTGLGLPLTCVGTNMAYRRSLYQDIGGFGPFKNILSGDDDLFLTRVREAKKYGILYATNVHAQVFNNPPQSWRQFVQQRLRYASKGFDYPAYVTTGLTAYFLFNLLLLILPVTGLADPLNFLKAGGILGVKTLADTIFMWHASGILNDRRAVYIAPVAALLHIPYVIFFGLAGSFKKYRWAE
jgi:cellulose synthase/poly-beta-1,6-N-acetylglucosamine synthase-like glycosyltransferase